MPTYKAEIRWNRNGARFLDHKYQRTHTWTFSSGLTMTAAASPHIVREAYTDSSVIDPEEAFTASVASCHMLWFLSIAAGRGFAVNNYLDRSEGVLEKNSEGILSMTKVIIKPVVSFEEVSAPNHDDFMEMHREAHEKCFIANSIKSEVEIKPKLEITQDL